MSILILFTVGGEDPPELKIWCSGSYTEASRFTPFSQTCNFLRKISTWPTYFKVCFLQKQFGKLELKLFLFLTSGSVFKVLFMLLELWP